MECYDASDEGSEVESDHSLSKWKGTCTVAEHDSVCPCQDFNPIPLDLYTASSIGHINAVKDVLHGSVLFLIVQS